MLRYRLRRSLRIWHGYYRQHRAIKHLASVRCSVMQTTVWLGWINFHRISRARRLWQFQQGLHALQFHFRHSTMQESLSIKYQFFRVWRMYLEKVQNNRIVLQTYTQKLFVQRAFYCWQDNATLIEKVSQFQQLKTTRDLHNVLDTWWYAVVGSPRMIRLCHQLQQQYLSNILRKCYQYSVEQKRLREAYAIVSSKHQRVVLENCWHSMRVRLELKKNVLLFVQERMMSAVQRSFILWRRCYQRKMISHLKRDLFMKNWRAISFAQRDDVFKCVARWQHLASSRAFVVCQHSCTPLNA